jgi:hypothetical protein
MRKCIVYKGQPYEFEGYFIGWTEKGDKQLHPENPQYDRVFIKTLAIIECCNTHQIELCGPEQIQFLESPTLL